MILEIASPTPIQKTFDYKLNGQADGMDPQDLIGRRVEIPFGFRAKSVGIVCGIKEKSDAPLEKLKSITAILDSESLLNAHQIELAQWLSARYLCSIGEALFSLLPPGRGNPQSFKEPKSDEHIHHEHHLTQESQFELTGDQKNAINIIHEAIYSPVIARSNATKQSKIAAAPAGPRNDRNFLLFGAAATGKTEVYMAAIKDVLDQSKSAMVLVPEIGLATQMAHMLRDRFGDENVLHWRSDVTPKQRLGDWWKIKRGHVPIVVGSRATILSPMQNLGLIVVDEEHDAAYKEDRKPRFNLRDVALKRGDIENATVVFGSASPSLEIFHRATEGELKILPLDERAVGSKAPRMHLIDLKEEKKWGILSRKLKNAIDERVKNKEQVILFINKRGFHRFLKCTACDWMAKCPNCGISLVQHKQISRVPGPVTKARISRDSGRGTQSLICHYCDHKEELPAKCPECKSKKLFSGGYGTQRVFDEIEEQFPWAKVVRMDRDTARTGYRDRGPEAMEDQLINPRTRYAVLGTDKIISDFKKGKHDILIGTIMVGQGFNFPKVSLVGILDADTGLYIPNFRGSENTFQNIMQVAGRSGRSMKTGDVYIQTRNKEHYAVKKAADMNYLEFAKEEMEFRKSLNYPPHSHIIKMETRGKNEKKSEREIEKFVEWIGDRPIGVLGPSEMKKKRKEQKTQFEVMLKIPNNIFEVFLVEMQNYLKDSKAGFFVDVDP